MKFVNLPMFRQKVFKKYKSYVFSLSSLAKIHKINVCIVGSGPAGFYTAMHLLSENPNIHIDIYEKRPVPFGLIRYGVAPDHPQIKNVEKTFTKIAISGRCNFYGNVDVGQDVSVKKLLDAYNAVVLAYGASESKDLGIPGENLGNVFSANAFIGWYNGEFENKDEKINLDAEVAAIIGQGNVALDVARILLRHPDELKTTDITDHAMTALTNSRIKKVILIGRRGPLNVSFTTKEFREMTKLQGIHVTLCSEDFKGIDNIIKSIERPRKRLTELMLETLKKSKDEHPGCRNFELKFFRSPKKFLPDSRNNVKDLVLTINQLKNSECFDDIESTEEEEIINCGLVIKSIGYRSVVIDPLIPFDLKEHVIPNSHGQVQGENCKGLYCSGWVKTGPKGVIPKTISDSYDTGEQLLNDLKTGIISNNEKSGSQEILDLLKKRGIKIVDFKKWEKVNEFEQKQGELIGKIRQKVLSLNEIFSIVE